MADSAAACPVVWRELEAELKTLSSVQRGDRLRVMGEVQVESKTNRWASAVARWIAGEGRGVTLQWLADLLSRVELFSTFCKQQAKSFAVMGEGATSFSADACPQCLRVRCACTILGLLRALECDLDGAVDGITRLSLTYADDPITQTSIFTQRDRCRRCKAELSVFLSENES